MKVFKKLVLVFLFGLSFYGCATSETADVSIQKINRHYPDPIPFRYVTKDLYPELKNQLPDFPATNTAAQLADEKELHDFQKNRSEADCDRARRAVVVTLQSFYGEPDGELKVKEVETLQPLLRQVINDGGPYIGQTKKGYARVRPYDYIKGLTPCVSKEDSLAYPSGHATVAVLYAAVLSDIFPKLKNKFQKRADQIAQDRILGGVHHPTDIESGKKLGQLLYNEMKKSKAYAEDIKKYKNLMKAESI